MLKKFLCGAVVATLLAGSALAPVQAEELYVRNRIFKDAYFIGNTTYVSVEPFLKAIDMPWELDGSVIVLGSGESPDWSADSESVVVRKDGEELTLNGILRGDTLYVPAKDLVPFVDYAIQHNSATGIIDIIKGRGITSSDITAQEEVRASKVKKKAPPKVTPETDDEDVSEDIAEVSDDDFSLNSDADEEEEGPPPVAEMVVLSTDADANTYTGEVIVRAVLQNQGNAAATRMSAKLIVVGPDGKQWINKTVHHPADLAPDGRWEIEDDYKHRLGAAAPRGAFDVSVVPTYETAAPKD